MGFEAGIPAAWAKGSDGMPNRQTSVYFFPPTRSETEDIKVSSVQPNDHPSMYFCVRDTSKTVQDLAFILHRSIPHTTQWQGI